MYLILKITGKIEDGDIHYQCVQLQGTMTTTSICLLKAVDGIVCSSKHFVKLRLCHCLQTHRHPTDQRVKTTQRRLSNMEASAVSRGQQSAGLAGLCPSFPGWSYSFQNSPGSFSKRPDCTALDYSLRLCILQNQSFLFQQEFLVFIFKAKNPKFPIL